MVYYFIGKGRGFILVHSLSWKGRCEDMGVRELVTLHRPLGNTPLCSDSGVHLTLSIFHQDPHRMVLPTCGVDLTFSTKPFWKHPYRCIQRYVSIVIF